jgi:hypothetical protein
MYYTEKTILFPVRSGRLCGKRLKAYNRAMKRFTQNLRRIGTDAAGYVLVLIGISLGWLPGPGGIPLILIGLALLAINNKWAATLRDAILRHSGNFLRIIFPANRFIQWLYDILTIFLFAGAFLFFLKHNAIWQISLAILLFFAALLVAVYNRDRLSHAKQRSRKRRPSTSDRN